MKLRGELRSNPTMREIQVIALVALGFESVGIAQRLGITLKTVETHRTNVYRRMNFKSVVDIAHWALAKGIVENKYQGGLL